MHLHRPPRFQAEGAHPANMRKHCVRGARCAGTVNWPTCGKAQDIECPCLWPAALPDDQGSLCMVGTKTV